MGARRPARFPDLIAGGKIGGPSQAPDAANTGNRIVNKVVIAKLAKVKPPQCFSTLVGDLTCTAAHYGSIK